MNPETSLAHLKPGDPHYRAYVGAPDNYDLLSAITFNLLTTLGLRQTHRVLDVGCGSLRNARLLIPYLDPGRYFGLEPNAWLIDEGIAHETGRDMLATKQAFFSYRSDCQELPTGSVFDFMLLQSIFSHCGEDLIGHWMQELRPFIGDETLLVATYYKTPHNSGEQGWLYPGLVSYNHETFPSLFGGYDLLYQDLPWPHPRQQWFLLTRSSSALARLQTTGLSFQNVYQNVREPLTAKAR